jgi:thiamine-phosphate pyrophosphorylase
MTGMEDSDRPERFYQGGVCFITDRKLCPLTCVEMAHVVLGAGVRWVQYRDKEKNRMRVYRTALMLRELTRSFGASLIINDYTDIAAAVDADGVHLGQEDFPLMEARKLLGGDKIIGISTHSLEEALEAEAGGADYVGFGPVYETATKDAGDPRGTAVLSDVGRKLKIPVVAIGGINPECLHEVMAKGASAVAVASSILSSGDIKSNARRFVSSLEECGSH